MSQGLRASLVGRVVRRYDRSSANNWATVIAWNALFSFVPIVIAVVAVFSFLLSRRDFAGAVAQAVARIASTRAERFDLLRTIGGLAQHRNLIAGIAAAGMLWSGSALFSAMDNSLSALYGVPARRFIVKRLRGMVFMLVFSALLVALVLSSALLSVGNRYSLLPNGVDGFALVLLQFISGTIISTIIFLLIYRVLPNRGHHVSRLLPGAFAAGLLLESLSALFPIYERGTNGAATYGVLIALLFLLLTFFFLLGQITVIGALVNVELSYHEAGRVASRSEHPQQQGDGRAGSAAPARTATGAMPPAPPPMP